MTTPESSRQTGPERAEFLRTADVEAVLDQMASMSFLPNLEDAVAIRDRAATLLTGDPTLAARLADGLSHAVDREGSVGDPQIQAVALRCRAESCLFLGRVQEAHRLYEEAAREAARTDAPALLGQILVGMVGVLGMMGNTNPSHPVARRAQRLLERAGDDIYLGKLFMNLGNAAYNGEHYADASRLYGSAAATFEKAGVRDGTWVGLLINQAVACTNLSNVTEARTLFLKAESSSRSLGLERMEAQALFNRAFLERLRGDYRTALALLESSGEIFERQGARDMEAATSRERAHVFLELGMGAEACDAASTAVATFEGEGMTLDAAMSRFVEGQGLLLQSRAREAIDVLDPVLTFFTDQRIWPRRAAAQLELARARIQLGDWQPAVEAARRALRSFESRRMLRLAVEARQVIAEAQRVRGRPDQAERTLEPALERSRSLSPGDRASLLRLAGRVALERGRRQDARRLLTRAVRDLEAQRGLIPGAEFRARAFENQVRAYHDLIEVNLTGKSPSFATIFQLVEAARGRGFRDRAQLVHGAGREVIEASRARLGSLTHRLEDAELSADGEPGTRSEIESLRREIRGLEKDLADQIRRAQIGASSEHIEPLTVDPDEVVDRLPTGTAVLEYLVLEDSVLALVLSSDGCQFQRLPGALESVLVPLDRIRLQLDMMAATSARPIGDPTFLQRSAESTLQALHAALVRPIAHLLPERGRVIVIPHGILHQVPFECLHDGTDYVDESWLVSRAPTAGFIAAGTRRGARSGSRRVLVSGTIRNAPPFVSREVESVAGRFDPARVDVLRDATTEELVSSLRGRDVVHLSAHGVFRDDNPLFSRISTANGALFMADLLGIRLDARLVVLSACNSGQVFAGRGDDLSGVAHAFLAAGARQLVASHWRVHDEATHELMERFYDNYLASSRPDPVRALTEARRHVRGRWSHPFYWGGFSVHGW